MIYSKGKVLLSYQMHKVAIIIILSIIVQAAQTLVVKRKEIRIYT